MSKAIFIPSDDKSHKTIHKMGAWFADSVLTVERGYSSGTTLKFDVEYSEQIFGDDEQVEQFILLNMIGPWMVENNLAETSEEAPGIYWKKGDMPS